jgi:hypothetical protein
MFIQLKVRAHFSNQGRRTFYTSNGRRKPNNHFERKHQTIAKKP